MVSCSQETEDERTNIVFIMSDDHAYQVVSADGHGLNETPNIDRIAEEGQVSGATVINSLYAPRSDAMILTGRHDL